VRYEKTTLSTFLLSALLASLIPLAALMCLSETFLLGRGLGQMLPLCLLMGAAAALSVMPRRYWPVLAAEGAALLLFVEWNRENVLESVQRLLYDITSRYTRPYGVTPMGASGGDSFAALVIIGLLLALLVAWVCSGRHSAIPVAVFCLPILVLCLLVVDIAPPLWLVMLCGGLIVLLLTNGTRLHDAEQGGKLGWYLTPAVAAFLAVLLLLSPPAAYQRSEGMQELQLRVESFFGVERAQPVYAAVTSAEWDADLQEVDLHTLGPRYRTGAPVLEYRTDTAISYLRGVSLGVYENNRWTALDPALFEGKFIRQPLIDGSSGDHLLEVQTQSVHSQQYTTYYLNVIPSGAAAVDDAYLKNQSRAFSYSSTYGLSQLPTLQTYDTFVKEYYTQLPEELRPELERFLEENGLEDLSPRALAAFVQRLGVYDLNTPAVPAGKDFVLYFLQQSHQGYCVHFASATTLLLRAQGVPARYVSGYSVTGDVNQWNTVTADEAHAWVEYYREGVGWQPVDPTPADWRATPGDRPPNPEEEEPGLPPLPDLPEQPDTPEQPEEPDTPEQPDVPNTPDTPNTPNTPDTPGKEPLDSGEGEGTGLAQGGEPGFSVRLSPRLLWLLAPPALWGLLVWRRRWTVKRRRRQFAQQPPNRAMLAMWRWLERLCRAGDTRPSEECRRLAEKARFSQHTVSAEELQKMEAAIDRAIDNLSTLKPLGKLWYYYIINLC